MYLVAGVTGNVGGAVVQALAEQGLPVRALVRDASRARLPEGSEAAVADLNDPDSLTPWLKGVEAVFMLPGYPDMAGLYQRMREAGVKRAVQLSGSSAGTGDTSNAVTAMMEGSEAAARESGIAWTVLRPSAFMSNTFRWLPELQAGDLVRAPWGDIPLACIDPADIAAVAVASMTDDTHAGAVYRLTGPRAMFPAEQLEILGRVLDRALRFEGLSLEETRAQLEATMPEKYVHAFWDFYVDGSLDESLVLPTVEEVIGRPPRTFEQWAEAHADDFR
ncbi:NAD(P)H-binding protein [Glycomyces luteolus]|uniref:NAD(P)H-binding protein n=1 Tax=Glycomyces luteolus TaxID=2670330 RepID=A0A9X3T2K9_9ACTN|nr:NAD(P)H-binding protein [Glycomyces luteolus]MDA1358885.1 NAD(P)H-binding protein [Glycomyces luteolus]